MYLFLNENRFRILNIKIYNSYKNFIQIDIEFLSK